MMLFFIYQLLENKIDQHIYLFYMQIFSSKNILQAYRSRRQTCFMGDFETNFSTNMS